MASSSSDKTISTSHMIIILGVALGTVGFIAICLLMTIFINRHERHRGSKKKKKKNPSEKLRKLDAVSPIRTLEEWVSSVKGPLVGQSEAVDNQFVCVVCLDPVLRSQQIRELKCRHVFHRECLEKWYLQDHFNCPLCHRAYFVQESRPMNDGSDWVWMV